MAAFKDQFERTNPFLSPSFLEYFGWLHQLWDEISELLANVDQQRRIAIARQIDALLTKSFEAKKFTKNGGMQRVAQSYLVKDISQEQFREMYGDFNLLKEVHDSHPWGDEKVASAKWERFAVFSLWKLNDAMWENAIVQSATGGFNIPPEGMKIRVPNMHMVMAYCFEAMRAQQVAETTLLTEKLVSKRNRDSTISAQALGAKNRLTALTMANSKPFKSLEKAATYVAEHLIKGKDLNGEGTTYSVDWVKTWLRDAGWKPQHKRSPTSNP